MQLAAVVAVAVAGGAMNAIAGGGTLLTFPALVGLGIPPIIANATSTVALWPGGVSSMWGYRRELEGARSWAIRFAVPSLIGGLVGALLLRRTSPETFAAVVPLLVLGATLLFMMQGPVMRFVDRHHPRQPSDGLRSPPLTFLAYQFFIAIYGGYFGAGVGILMLAALGFMGLTNIHRMNGLKNWGALCMNFIAGVTFTLSGLVNWPVALSMAVGAILGGHAGSVIAQRVRQDSVRKAIAFIGLASAAWLALDYIRSTRGL